MYDIIVFGIKYLDYDIQALHIKIWVFCYPCLDNVLYINQICQRSRVYVLSHCTIIWQNQNGRIAIVLINSSLNRCTDSLVIMNICRRIACYIRVLLEVVVTLQALFIINHGDVETFAIFKLMFAAERVKTVHNITAFAVMPNNYHISGWQMILGVHLNSERRFCRGPLNLTVFKLVGNKIGMIARGCL